MASSKDGTAPRRGRGRRWVKRLAILVCLVAAVWVVKANYRPRIDIDYSGPTAGWMVYGKDSGGSRYSPLTQITRENVEYLEKVWVYQTGEDYTGTRYKNGAAFEATPILVDGTLYLSTQTARVIALDPETGQEKWAYDPATDSSKGIGGEMTTRGVSTWPLGSDSREGVERRIFVATLDARLVALNASDGSPCQDFGDNGQVNMAHDVEMSYNYELQVTSPPAVVGDLVIVGSAIGDNNRVDAPRGMVRAYDARTGEPRWKWDPVPKSPEASNWEEWIPEQARTTGGGNAWSILSADPERDLVFVPTGSCSPDYYGGEREGTNRWANSVVALRASTGQVVWGFQVVHHDLWDYDVPAQPTLITVRKDGKEIDAVVQATKMGHLFFFDRETGEPLFPIEERPVPASDVPGEKAWPTQPFPTKPRALVPQRLTEDDLWGILPGDKKFARERFATLRNEGLFTPPSFQGSLHYPGVAGGTNWGGVAFDPVRGLVILNASRIPYIITLIPREDAEAFIKANPSGEYGPQRGTPYVMRREMFISPSQLPVTKPPWGTLAAVDAATGEVRWEVPLGTVRDLAPVPIPMKWGTPNLGGPMVSGSGLVFISATMDYYLRAFDIETGRELWKGRLPAGGQATPMTYRLREDGKQYVVICAGGHGKMNTKLGDYVIAFALPS